MSQIVDSTILCNACVKFNETVACGAHRQKQNNAPNPNTLTITSKMVVPTTSTTVAAGMKYDDGPESHRTANNESDTVTPTLDVGPEPPKNAPGEKAKRNNCI